MSARSDFLDDLRDRYFRNEISAREASALIQEWDRVHPPLMEIGGRPVPDGIAVMISGIRDAHPEWNRVQRFDHIERAISLVNAHNSGQITLNQLRSMLGLEIPIQVRRINVDDPGYDWTAENELYNSLVNSVRDDEMPDDPIKPSLIKPRLEDLPCHKCLYKTSKMIDDKYNNTGGKLFICDKLTEKTGRKWSPVDILKMMKCKDFQNAETLLQEPSRWRRLTFRSE